MPLEATAVDRLVDKANFHPDVALAIAEAVDITIQSHHRFVTVPMMDARFAALETKLEVRFASIEKMIESTKTWAMTLHAGLAIALFTALAVDTHWLVSRQDQLISQLQARS